MFKSAVSPFSNFQFSTFRFWCVYLLYFYRSAALLLCLGPAVAASTPNGVYAYIPMYIRSMLFSWRSDSTPMHFFPSPFKSTVLSFFQSRITPFSHEISQFLFCFLCFWCTHFLRNLVEFSSFVGMRLFFTRFVLLFVCCNNKINTKRLKITANNFTSL